MDRPLEFEDRELQRIQSVTLTLRGVGYLLLRLTSGITLRLELDRRLAVFVKWLAEQFVEDQRRGNEREGWRTRDEAAVAVGQLTEWGPMRADTITKYGTGVLRKIDQAAAAKLPGVAIRPLIERGPLKGVRAAPVDYDIR